MSYLVDNETLTKLAEVIGGEEAVKIINILKDVDEITDEEIVDKTGIKLNDVRKILYKLYDHSIVSLRRNRDKKTGWFIFHWKVQRSQIEGYIKNLKLRVLEKLETRLDYERSHDFYHCGNPECEKVSFEEAMENLFRCL
ncbi:MAG: transcription factor, partial [Candidatus Bathyarchaeia archaeon]